MEIKFLKAFNGDCIHISFADSDKKIRNILIDGGTKGTYNIPSKKESTEGDLTTLVNEIKAKDNCIDLLILTHVDDDHIGGILKWFENDLALAQDIIKEVWFNSGRLICKHFDWPEIQENLRMIKILKGRRKTGIAQGAAFEDYITEFGIWHQQIIMAGMEFERFGAKFQILSPDEYSLRRLLHKWQIEKPISRTSAGKRDDYAPTLLQHAAADKFEEDDKIHNGSSIAFIMTLNDVSYLFLADAHPAVVEKSLHDLNYTVDSPLEAAFMKVSHHGSQGNTSPKLFAVVKTSKYIISTNGKGHKHPNKQLLARLLAINKNKGMETDIYFNYPDLIDKIFKEADYADFPNFKPQSTDNLKL